MSIPTTIYNVISGNLFLKLWIICTSTHKMLCQLWIICICMYKILCQVLRSFHIESAYKVSGS